MVAFPMQKCYHHNAMHNIMFIHAVMYYQSSYRYKYYIIYYIPICLYFTRKSIVVLITSKWISGKSKYNYSNYCVKKKINQTLIVVSYATINSVSFFQLGIALLLSWSNH